MKGRTRVITYVNKSLVQAFESCRSPHAPTVLPTLVGKNWLSKCIIYGQLKIGCNTQRAKELVWLCFCPKNGLRSNLRASNFQTFPGGAWPLTPLILYAYEITHPCNPPSRNPGYGPEQLRFPQRRENLHQLISANRLIQNHNNVNLTCLA